MPEFQLDTSGAELEFADLDAFTQGYIEALFFTDSGPDENQLGDAGFADLAPKALEHIIRDCKRFQEVAQPWLEQVADTYDDEQAGRDFWFTRNGHGVGFWDREQLEEGGIGDKLSALCGWRTAFSEVDAYLGDDGQVHLA